MSLKIYLLALQGAVLTKPIVSEAAPTVPRPETNYWPPFEFYDENDSLLKIYDEYSSDRPPSDIYWNKPVNQTELEIHKG